MCTGLPGSPLETQDLKPTLIPGNPYACCSLKSTDLSVRNNDDYDEVGVNDENNLLEVNLQGHTVRIQDSEGKSCALYTTSYF